MGSRERERTEKSLRLIVSYCEEDARHKRRIDYKTRDHDPGYHSLTVGCKDPIRAYLLGENVRSAKGVYQQAGGP